MDFKRKELAGTTLIGLSMSMSLTQNKTPELWRSFMQTCGANQFNPLKPLISLQVYEKPEDYTFPNAIFTKWAGFFANEDVHSPSFLQRISIPGGSYAVFDFNGGPANAMPFFSEVFTKVLPQAGYSADFRPHFEILHDNYRENFQEEIWIPIRSS